MCLACKGSRKIVFFHDDKRISRKGGGYISLRNEKQGAELQSTAGETDNFANMFTSGGLDVVKISENKDNADVLLHSPESDSRFKIDDGPDLDSIFSADFSIFTGEGYAQIEERSAILDMSSVTKNTYHKKRSRLPGVSSITVAADGSWAKRSYKSAYNSLSGLVKQHISCIAFIRTLHTCSCRDHNEMLLQYVQHLYTVTGLKTGWILYIRIRNSYCRVCANSEAETGNKPGHVCLKNWNGPATSMEADIIAEGFKTSVLLHGIKCGKLIDNCVPDMVLYGLWDDLKSTVNFVAHYAPSFIHYLKNNLAELFKSYVEKLIGAKRVNYALKGSYEGRRTFTKAVVNRKEHDKLRSKRKLLFYGEKKNNKRTKQREVSYPNEGYGKMCTLEEKPDMAENEFKKNKENFLSSLKLDVNEIEGLQKRTVLQSQSQLWKPERAKSCRALQELEGIEVRKCGLFVDIEHPFLAASPDRLIGDTGVVEVRCPLVACNYTNP
ncbi:hypothetical protein PR048_018596 [Dryococelus australis]|uniref:Mutator-like transposase domain-containing protein n=1 Tax=Dryococelus australis TaxID=614101 RepID=A0ABQ9HCR9_9NEOP|nr:hypothetical protein PR048_018596 [Dryococelus australis]